MTELPSPGPELAWRNRMIIAVRTEWPPGALENCEQLDRAHPGWSVWWARSMRRHPEARYVAQRGDVAVCAVTPEELADKMAAAPERAKLWWQRNKCCWPESWDG